MNSPGSNYTPAGVDTCTAHGEAQDGPYRAKAPQGADVPNVPDAAPVSSQKEAEMSKVLYGHHASPHEMQMPVLMSFRFLIKETARGKADRHWLT